MKLVCVARGPLAVRALQRGSVERDLIEVQQLAQHRLAQQLPQLRRIDPQRLRATLGQRRIALVEKLRHETKEQRGSERRGPLGLDGVDSDLPLLHQRQQLRQSRQIKGVLQAFSVGFQHNREGSVLAGHRQQIGRALALHPQRRALSRIAPRQKQCPGRRLAEAGREDRRLPDRAHHQRFDLCAGGKQHGGVRQALCLGKPKDHAFVRPDGFTG